MSICDFNSLISISAAIGLSRPAISFMAKMCAPASSMDRAISL